MTGRTKSATPLATEPSAPAPAPPEHIFIGSEDLTVNPAAAARTLRERTVLRNKMRRTGAELGVYDEGLLKVVELDGSSADEPFFLDLRYLDPVPKIERVVAARWLTAALGCAVLASLAVFLLRFDALHGVAQWAVGVAAIATAVTLYIGVYRSYESTEFCTLHGRVPVLRLLANFGSLKAFRAFVPVLSRAIDEAAERIEADTAAYLRGEMREHYRLRGEGVLDNDECARGTGRILTQFDVQL